MHRFVTVLCLPVLVSACAVVDIPDPATDQPAWVEQRIESGDRREAPAVIPVTSLEPGEEQALDRSAAALIRARDALNAEAERGERPADQPGTSEFVATGQERTTPPDDQ